MAGITGPKIQPPTAQSPFVKEDGLLSVPAAVYLHSIEQTVFNISRSGPTASRPTSTLDGRFVGMNYFDTDLGKPIWLKIASSNAWVDATGAPA